MTRARAPSRLFAIVADVANILAATEGAERRVERVLALVRRALPCDRIALRDASCTLAPALITEPEAPPSEREELERQLTGVVDLLAEPPEAGKLAPAPAESGPITSPVIGGGEVVGALRAERFGGAFDEPALALLAAVASQIGAYLCLIRAEQALRDSERRLAELAARAPTGAGTRQESGLELEHERRIAEQRFLAEVGTLLASSLDHDELLTSIATLAVRELADCCIIYVASDEGRIDRVKALHADPAKEALAHALERLPGDPRCLSLGRAALETRQPILVEAISSDYLAAHAQSPEDLAVLEELAPTSLTAVPLAAHGQILGALVLLSTRPDRRYGELDLQLAEELARRAALAIANARLYDSARRAVRARDEVLGVVAHDLRAPLSTIQLAGDSLRRKLESAGVAGAIPSIDAILRATRQGERLIRDLIDLHRLEAEELSLEFSGIPLTAWLHEVVADHQPLATSASLDLRLEVDGPPLVVWGDRERLAQVLQNLLGNAIKFTPGGGHIDVTAQRFGHHALVSVTDSGQGIAPDHLARIFDRFFRADPGDRRGAGLGLAISKGIVEAHGGRIWVESEPGTGAAFHFTVPAAGELSDARPAAP